MPSPSTKGGSNTTHERKGKWGGYRGREQGGKGREEYEKGLVRGHRRSKEGGEQVNR